MKNCTNRSRYTSVILTGLLLIIASVVHGADPKAEAILMQQSAYFQAINSLECSFTSTVTYNEALQTANGGPPKRDTRRQKLVVSGTCFSTESTFYQSDRDGSDSTRTILAYDGNVYQSLTDHGQIRLQRSRPWRNLYHNWTPITVPFVFAFDREEAIAFSTLRNPQKWAQLVEQVVAVEDNVSKLGYVGCKLTFSKPPGSEYRVVYEVFFAEALEYFPVYVKAVVSSLSSSEVLTWTELAVTKTTTAHGGLAFPKAWEITDYFEADTRQSRDVVQLNNGSLKVNQPVAADAFRIPSSEGTGTYDADLEMMVK